MLLCWCGPLLYINATPIRSLPLASGSPRFTVGPWTRASKERYGWTDAVEPLSCCLLKLTKTRDIFRRDAVCVCAFVSVLVVCGEWVQLEMKIDRQGKFTAKNEDLYYIWLTRVWLFFFCATQGDVQQNGSKQKNINEHKNSIEISYHKSCLNDLCN